MQPTVIWAQHKDVVLVTVTVHDAIKPNVTISKDSFTFTGKSSDNVNDFNLNLELFAEIDPTQSKFIVRPRGTEIVLHKVDDKVWWPRLAKTTKKLHYVSVDWNRWIDSESDDEGNGVGDFGGPDFYGDDDEDDDDMEDVSPEPVEGGEEPAPETDSGAPPVD